MELGKYGKELRCPILWINMVLLADRHEQTVYIQIRRRKNAASEQSRHCLQISQQLDTNVVVKFQPICAKNYGSLIFRGNKNGITYRQA